MIIRRVRNDNINPFRKCHCEFDILVDSCEAISRVEPQRTQSIIVFKKKQKRREQREKNSGLSGTKKIGLIKVEKYSSVLRKN
jgi:hypothetical protein